MPRLDVPRSCGTAPLPSVALVEPLLVLVEPLLVVFEPFLVLVEPSRRWHVVLDLGWVARARVGAGAAGRAEHWGPGRR